MCLILAALKHQQIRIEYWNGECKPLKAEYALLWLNISSLKAGWIKSHGKQPFVENQEDSQPLPQFPAAFPWWFGWAVQWQRPHWALQVFGAVRRRSPMWERHSKAKLLRTDFRLPALQRCIKPSPLLEAKPHSFTPLSTEESLPQFKNLQMVAPRTTQTQQLKIPRLQGTKHAKDALQSEGCVTAVGLPLAEHLFKGSE